MTQSNERGEAHYETHEVPFGRVYEWRPARIILECGCGEKLTFTAASTITTCRCGADHTDAVHRIQEREGKLRDKVAHPWRHDTKEQAKQRLRDEAAYPGDSPWRYNDVTSDRASDQPTDG